MNQSPSFMARALRHRSFVIGAVLTLLLLGAAALSLVYNIIIIIVCWVFYTVMTNAGAERAPKKEKGVA